MKWLTIQINLQINCQNSHKVNAFQIYLQTFAFSFPEEPCDQIYQLRNWRKAISRALDVWESNLKSVKYFARIICVLKQWGNTSSITLYVFNDNDIKSQEQGFPSNPRQMWKTLLHLLCCLFALQCWKPPPVSPDHLVHSLWKHFNQAAEHMLML